MKSLFVTLVLVLGTLSAQAQTKEVWVNIGGALSPQDCSQRAALAGYPRYYYGPGYDWRGQYWPYVNACFGVKPGNESGGTNYLTPSLETSIYSHLLRLEMQDKSGYQSVLPALRRFQEVLDILIEAGKDGLSKKAVEPLFKDTRYYYGQLVREYYEAHKHAQNSKVERQWRTFAKKMDVLIQMFR